MITQWTKELCEKYGWKFVVSHDVDGKAIPDCWVHDDYPTQYEIERVLAIISKQCQEYDKSS